MRGNVDDEVIQVYFPEFESFSGLFFWLKILAT